MDSKIMTYRQIIKGLFNRYIELFNRHPEADTETMAVLDDQQDHYLIHAIGWQGIQRVWNTTLYVRIRNGKIWIEIDWLEHGITPDLLVAGVPKEDIVLAFQHPQLRPLTEFAVA